jgi:hypothetical protein
LQVLSTRFHLSSPAAKNIPLSFFPKLISPAHVPRLKEGRFAIVTNVERGMRWTSQCQALLRKTTDNAADGQAVWSWHPDADAKVAVL